MYADDKYKRISLCPQKVQVSVMDNCLLARDRTGRPARSIEHHAYIIRICDIHDSTRPSAAPHTPAATVAASGRLCRRRRRRLSFTWRAGCAPDFMNELSRAHCPGYARACASAATAARDVWQRSATATSEITAAAAAAAAPHFIESDSRDSPPPPPRPMDETERFIPYN